MAAANVISIIGVGITVLTYGLSNIPEGRDQTKLSYIIANDGANGDLSNAGGDLPDVRLWDDTVEFLGATYDPGSCDEGVVDCTTDVNTQEGPTYTLFSGNNDAICIAWTSIAWAGGNVKYSFHPGNWAHGCDVYGSGRGDWYYAGQQVPGLSNEDDVYCAWMDADGDLSTTGISVHWPEFDSDESPTYDLGYYCNNNWPVEYHTENDPNQILPAPSKFRRSPDLSARQQPNSTTSAGEKFASDPRLIKSHLPKHKASELCDHELRAAGQSFVSYSESKFCYMPTKTLYDFCANVDAGACWDDEANQVTVKNGGSVTRRQSVPDMSHIKKVIEWGS